MRVVPPSYFWKGALEIAPDVLGKLLCRRMPDGSVLKLRITETEAYCGESDTAAHVRRGRTPRTEVLYREGGKAYVYHCHMWWLLNLSCGPEGDPQCVLIRGVEGADGPGKAAERMRFTRDLYGSDLIPENGLWLEDDGYKPGYRAGPRVGIPYASEEDRKREWNFRRERFQKRRGGTSGMISMYMLCRMWWLCVAHRPRILGNSDPSFSTRPSVASGHIHPTVRRRNTFGV